MRLPDILVYADIHHLSRIAQEYDLQVNLHSKNDLVQSLLQQIFNPHEMKERLERLTPAERSFLLLLLAEERKGYTLEELTHRAKLVVQSDSEGRKVLMKGGIGEDSIVEKILRYGWVYNRKERNVSIYRIPEDLKEMLVASIIPRFQETSGQMGFSVKKVRTERFEVPNDQQIPMSIHDLFRFLRFVKEEWVQLTLDGVIHKRLQGILFRQLSTGESPLTERGWRFGYGRRFRDYPDLFSLLYDYAFARGWIEEKPGVLLLSESGNRLLAGEEQVTPKDLFAFWVSLYRKPIPNLPSLLSLIKLLTKEGFWEEELYRQLEPFISPFYYDNKEKIFQKRVLAPLFWMEGLEVIRREGIQMLRLSSLWERWYG
ncbi:conserved hypothetical protein [[Clostridium] ultunense Esp]|nr:conserved hypothetical protein [[Clostridium] ultunense Esp]